MKNVILLLMVIVSIYSCEKINDIEKTEVSTLDYLPMSVGNYWVYDVNDSFPNGIGSQTTSYDSVIISSDTLIKGKKYFRFDYFHRNDVKVLQTDTIFCRDSLKNLITPKGQILFSEDNFQDTLLRNTEIFEGDTLYTITYKMEQMNDDFSVPAGKYNNLLNFRGTVIINPKNTSGENLRYTNKYFAKNIGVIYQLQIWIPSGGTREKRLVRYNINQ